MKFNAECSKPRLAALIIVTNLLTGCATASSKPVIGVCPPVMEYDVEFQARAAEEVHVLSNGSAVVEMLSDYAVIREQARGCQS